MFLSEKVIALVKIKNGYYLQLCETLSYSALEWHYVFHVM